MRVLTIVALWVLVFGLTGWAMADGTQAPPAPRRVSAVWRWDSREDFDQCYRNRYLDSLSEPGAVKLARGIVVADEMGAGYNDFQPVRGKTLARKVLVLDSADVRAATLLVGGSVKGCDILVNGTLLGGEPLERSYWHAEFERYKVPPRLLRAGANEFVFRARQGGSGSIRIERSQQPDRSAVSHDGGYLWDSDHLGEGGYINGELEVRLRLDRYAPSAWLHSPVLDLASVVKTGGIPAGTLGRVEALLLDADVPRGTSVRAFVRTGPTPDGCGEAWSRWYAWPGERDAIGFERFAQWRLELATRHPRRTPRVRRVELRASALSPRERPGAPQVRVIEDRNRRIVRSSYPFAYGRYGGRLRVLREHWNLEQVVAGADGELERFKALRQWVREQWRNGWDLGALQYVPPWDARVILSLAPQNLSLGMCTHYATTYVQCCQALGYTARSIFRGHALSEVWSNEFEKWIVMDAGMDPNDRRRATYHFERDGVPLNELEVHEAYFIKGDWDGIRILATNMSAGSSKPEPAFPEDREALFRSTRQLFMPLRNNFLEHREPEEPEHGMGYFKFLGHIYWKDSATPDIPWTDFFTTRRADLYWTLNQAQLFLLADGAEAGELRVMLDTETPNFAGYEWRLDGGPWTAWRRRADRPLPNPEGVRAYPLRHTGCCVAFTWKLHPGRNTIEARPFNEAGIRGIVSRMVVEVGEP